MKPKASDLPRRSTNLQRESPHWVLIAGGALLSTLSFRFGYKLKELLDSKQRDNVNGKSTDRKKSGSCCSHPNDFCSSQEENGCYNHYPGSRNGQMVTEPELALPLATIPTHHEFTKDNGVMWSSSPDRLELPQKPFHHSNSSESPCVSESGSDIFSKREVIQKLRQQLKRRDDMILEMQDQISELQNTCNGQLSHSSHLQSLLDASNRDLFDSEREIQKLRKAIADHCVGNFNSSEKIPTVPSWPMDGRNNHVNGFPEVEINLDSLGRGDREKIESLKKEISELKELIDGKEYVLKNYKEQNSELTIKIKELQRRLDAQLPNIL